MTTGSGSRRPFGRHDARRSSSRGQSAAYTGSRPYRRTRSFEKEKEGRYRPVFGEHTGCPTLYVRFKDDRDPSPLYPPCPDAYRKRARLRDANKLSGRFINVGASKIVELFTSKAENTLPADDRDVDA